MEIKSLLINLAILTFILASGCMESSDGPSGEDKLSENLTSASVPGNDVLYQVSTIDALLPYTEDSTVTLTE